MGDPILCDVPFDSQVAEKQLHFGFRLGQQLFSHLHMMEADVPADPITIALFGADGVMLEPHHLSDLVQQLELGVGYDHPMRGRIRACRCVGGSYALTLLMHGVTF